MDKQNALMEFIQTEIMKSQGQELGADEDLLANGVLDSLAILRLVSFIEERFKLNVPDEDVVYENFHSVSALSEYLETL